MIADLLRTTAPARAGTAVEEQRAQFESVGAVSPVPEDVTCSPVVAGGVPCEWVHAPAAEESGRVLLYLHGGGYVIGSIATHRLLAARLSAAAGARVLVAGYRLAPEHPFPAAVDDAVAAYRWLLARGVAGRSIGLAGDSAGAGLALAATVRARDEGESLPGALACFSPWVDLALRGGTMVTRAEGEAVVPPALLSGWAAAYLSGADATAPLASPLYADLRALPPMLVLVGTEEVLYDDAARLVERAVAAGVEVTMEVFDDCFHLWTVLAPTAPEASRAIDLAGAFLRSHLEA